MLAGIFKTFEESACVCHALQVVDRIWIGLDGSASIIRDSILEVDELSPCALSRLLMIVPSTCVTSVKDLSATMYSRDYYLNHRSRLDAFAVTQRPQAMASSDVENVSEAVIRQYEFSGIHVFSNVPTTSAPFVDATMLDLRIARGIEPGERVGIRTSFVVPDQLIGDGVADCRHLRLRYFSARQSLGALEQLDSQRTCIPILLESNGIKCGLDVAVFFPQALHVNSPNPSTFDRRPDTASFSGPGETFFIRYLWHASDLSTGQLEPVRTPISIDCGEVCPPDSTARDVQELQNQVTALDERLTGSVRRVDDRLEGLGTSTRLSTVLAIVALVVTVLAVAWSVYTFVIDHQPASSAQRIDGSASVLSTAGK